MIPTTSTNTSRRRALSTLTGLVLLLVLSAQAVVALTWASPVRLASTETYRPQIVRTGSSSAIAVWQRGSNAYARRTADGGRTWSATVNVASGVRVSISVAGAGGRVDLAYVRQVASPTGGSAYRLFYRRSLDGGATWKAPVALTSASSLIADQDVARHPNGQVAVAWTGLTTGNLYTRTSTDGGATFAPARYVGRTTNREPGRTVIYRGDPAIALGAGVTYVAYTSARDVVSVRRSTNLGGTWSPAAPIASQVAPEYTLVADGTRAVLGYTTSRSGTMQAAYRRTTDRGATWSAPGQVAALTPGQFSTTPQFAFADGVLGVVLKQGRPGGSPVWYRSSTDFGATWSGSTRVSLVHVADPDPEPAGLAILGSRRIAGYNENRGVGNSGLWVRAGQ
jgi:hypothetical protein